MQDVGENILVFENQIVNLEYKYCKSFTQSTTAEENILEVRRNEHTLKARQHWDKLVKHSWEHFAKLARGEGDKVKILHVDMEVMSNENSMIKVYEV